MRFTSLREYDNGYRPVTVDEILWRIVCSLLMRRVSSHASANMLPMYVGVATSGGCEAIVRASRRIVRNLGTSKGYALFQVDFERASLGDTPVLAYDMRMTSFLLRFMPNPPMDGEASLPQCG